MPLWMRSEFPVCEKWLSNLTFSGRRLKLKRENRNASVLTNICTVMGPWTLQIPGLTKIAAQPLGRAYQQSSVPKAKRP